MEVYDFIERTLIQELSPEYLDVVNESDGHNVPKGSETHFKIVVVSDKFQGLNPVKRQQLVYGILAEALAGPVHALSMATHTPLEWAKGPENRPSPPCMGG